LHFDDNFYYIGGLVFTMIRQFWNEQGSPFPVPEKDALKMLASQNLIITKDGRTKLPKKIGGKAQRVVWLRRKAVDEE